MRKRQAGLLLFALAVLLLIAGLRALSWLPAVTRNDLLARYGSLEEVQARGFLREIFIPTYVPQNLKWPPSTILAQGKPYPALVMEFERIDREDVVLVISQSVSSALRLDDKIRIAQVRETAHYALKGRDVILEVGPSATGETCSKLSWSEGNVKITVLSKSPPFEMIKVAESMVR